MPISRSPTDLAMELLPPSTLLAGMGSGLALGIPLAAALRRDDTSSPARDDWISDKIQRSGLDLGYAHEPSFVIGGEYMPDPSNDLEEVLTEFSYNTPDDYDIHPATFEALKRRVQRMSEAGKAHGLVLTGAGNKRKDTIGHEMGHAMSAHSAGPISKALHGMNYGGLIPAASGIGGGIIGALIAKRPILGGLIGGTGAGVLTSLPVVADEYNASRLGRKLLGDEADQVSNNPAINYLTLPAAMGATTGIGAGVGTLLSRILARKLGVDAVSKARSLR